MKPILLPIFLTLLLAGLASAEGRPVGDAFTDPENPIRKIWGGERLDLWSLKKPVRTAPPGDLRRCETHAGGSVMVRRLPHRAGASSSRCVQSLFHT